MLTYKVLLGMFDALSGKDVGVDPNTRMIEEAGDVFRKPIYGLWVNGQHNC